MTLGWPILGWTRDYLQQPDGPQYQEPWVYTDEQARFILNWFGIDAEGDWLYRYAMLRRMKGWGKDPVGATICGVEFVGPCRFGGWDHGEPIATPNPAAWIQTAAVSKEQTRNTMTLFPGLFTPKAIEEFGIDIGKEIIYADRGRRRIEAVTSSPRALEGGRASFVLKNETHHWIRANEGHEMAAVIARNTAKSRDGEARVMAISNAHAPGEDSDAERDYDAFRQGADGMLYDSIEAPDKFDFNDDDQVKSYIPRGDSDWVSRERLLAEIRDPRTTPAMAYRYYLNKIHAEEDKPFDRAKWAANAKPDYVVAKGALITLGFDGSISRDHTALIGTEVETGHQFVVGYWEPEMIGGELKIDTVAVNETIAFAFDEWKVWRLYADPSKWALHLAKWAGDFGEDRIVSWPTTLYRKMATSFAQYRAEIHAGELTHDGDPRFTAAIVNSHKHMMYFRDDDGEMMWLIQKERPDSPLKVDAAYAGGLSAHARRDALAANAHREKEVVWGSV